MPYGPQSSEAEHPHRLFSARWFLDDLEPPRLRTTICWWSVRATAMTRWWSSSGAERARCPKNLKRKDFRLASTRWYCLVDVHLMYGIRKIFRRHQVSKASRRFSRVLVTVHVSHPWSKDTENVGPVELHLRLGLHEPYLARNCDPWATFLPQIPQL